MGLQKSLLPAEMTCFKLASSMISPPRASIFSFHRSCEAPENHRPCTDREAGQRHAGEGITGNGKWASFSDAPLYHVQKSCTFLDFLKASPPQKQRPL